MKGKLKFLGTGASTGVPVIGCLCEVCRSQDPLNKRLRTSALLELDNRQFLIDAGPDFRFQALRIGLTQIDALILTHAHQDHIAGMDDLRPLLYRREKPLPVLLSQETAHELKGRFHYLFDIPRFEFHLLPDLNGEMFFEGVDIQYVSYRQGGMLVNGFRFGDCAYLSDIRDFSPPIFDQLRGVKLLIISALRHAPSFLHLSVDEAVAFSQKLKAEKVWITHISHELEHHQTNSGLPANIQLAYDGLEIEFH